MNIDEDDLKVVDELLKQEHQLKQASFKLIYSHIFYHLNCKTKRKMKSVRVYREKIEKNLLDEGKIDAKKSAVLNASEKGMNEETDSLHDPFTRFGPGVFTYFKVQQELIKFLMFLSIISVIQMNIFYIDHFDNN